jgi:hypothetical protein
MLAHPEIRSIAGLYRHADDLHVIVRSSRLGTLISPSRVLADYDRGKVLIGPYPRVQVPPNRRTQLIRYGNPVNARSHLPLQG